MKKFPLLVLLTLFMLQLTAVDLMMKHVKTDSSKFPMMISSLQVLDSSDEPITDLKADNYSVFLANSEAQMQELTTYEKSGRGVYVMLCIDSSGSMRGKPIQDVKAAVIPFIEKLRRVDKLAICSYADDYVLHCDYTNEKDLLKNTINSITPSGNYTSLYYGAHKAIESMANIQEDVGKILILIGDGKDENPTGSYKEEDVIQKAQVSSIPIFTIGYTRQEQIYLQSLERLADSSGGSYYYAPGASELKDHYDKLHRQIMGINIIGYTVYGVEGDGSEQNLKIEVKDDQSSGSVTTKVQLPAGKKAHNRPANKKGMDELLLPIGIGVVVIVLIVILVVILRKKAKRKEAEHLRELQRIQDQKDQEMEQERQKRHELETKIQESQQKEAEVKSSISAPPIDVSRERTMIIDPGRAPSSGTNSLRIEIKLGAGTGSIYDVGTEGATIGRRADNSIVLQDPSVSGYHAKISCNGGVFVLEDLDSTNGTYIDGNKVQIIRLVNNCTFKMGGIEGEITLV